MNNLCSLYFSVRIVLGLLDIATDSLLCASLILEGHLFWATLVGGWVVVALLSSFLSVLIRRCQRGEPLPASKYLLLTLKIHTEYGQAFFQSGPQLIIQTALIWTGIYRHDFQVGAERRAENISNIYHPELCGRTFPGLGRGLAAGAQSPDLLPVSPHHGPPLQQ